jgi:hypothetical protein
MAGVDAGGTAMVVQSKAMATAAISCQPLTCHEHGYGVKSEAHLSGCRKFP